VEVEAIVLESARVHVHDWCNHCDLWFDAWAVIEGGRFVGIEGITGPPL
jgi:hypothetical protein